MAGCGTCGGKRNLSWAERRYTTERQQPSDIYRHLPVMRSLVVATGKETGRPVTVIELGVRRGASTAAWLHGIEQAPHGGHLFAVDPVRPPEAIVGQKQVTWIEGDDTDPAVLAQLPEQADIVFVDTSHEYGHTVAEIGAYAPRLLPGGAMVFHDTAVARFPHHTGSQPPFPVATAVSEWVAKLRANGGDPGVQEWTRNNGLMIVHPDAPHVVKVATG